MLCLWLTEICNIYKESPPGVGGGHTSNLSTWEADLFASSLICISLRTARAAKQRDIASEIQSKMSLQLATAYQDIRNYTL